MKKYLVKKGRHDFRPNDQPFIMVSNKVKFEIYLDESLFWLESDEDYPYGNDIQDINKFCGLTALFPFGKNKSSAILGWRPYQSNQKSNTKQLELFAYVNDSKGKFTFESFGLFPVESTVEGFITWLSDSAHFNLKTSGEAEYKYQRMDLKRPKFPWLKFYQGIGGWFGGNRTAHKKMKFYAEFRFS